MLSELSVLAEREEVLKLIQVAIPAVIEDIFSSLPLITIEPIRVMGLDGGKVFQISTNITRNIRRYLEYFPSIKTHNTYGLNRNQRK